VQLNLALRVRNAKNRNRLRLLDKRGGCSEDRSKRSDLDHSKNEVFRGDPRSISRAYRRIRIRCQQSLNGEYRQDEFLFHTIGLLQNPMFKLLRSKLFIKTFKDSL
jgi:hypothetical protein